MVPPFSLSPFERASTHLPLLLFLAGGSDCHGPSISQEAVTDSTKRVATAIELVTERWKAFSQGNWMFYVDSLLICSLPTEFWMGMGVCWLVTSIAASTTSVLAGWRLRKS